MPPLDEFDATDIALYHIVFIGNSIDNTIKAFSAIIDKVDLEHERALYVSTYSQVLIQTLSFLDEYHNFVRSADPDLDMTINAIKKAVRPAVVQINEWKELEAFRNNALAHNLRDVKNKISVFQRGLSSYDVPKTGFELSVLQNCIAMIKKTFESGFRERLRTIQDYLDRTDRPAEQVRVKDEQDMRDRIERITAEINSNILELKRGVSAQGDVCSPNNDGIRNDKIFT
jgi:hypothetical protein